MRSGGLFRRRQQHAQQGHRCRAGPRVCGLWPRRCQHRVLDEWAYGELRRMAAPEGMLRLGRRGETLLARLEIRDANLRPSSRSVPRRSTAVARRSGGFAAKSWRLSFAAAASLIVTAVYRVAGFGEPDHSLRPAWRRVQTRCRHRQEHPPGSLDARHLGTAFACGTARERSGRTRGARQARRQAGNRRGVAVPAACRGGAPCRAQRHRAAREVTFMSMTG